MELTAGANKASRLLLENDVNPGTDAFATGVAAIKFDVAPLGAFSSWREFDVEGSATTIPPPTVPEPSTFLLSVLSFIGMVARRRRRIRLSPRVSGVG